MNLKMRKFKFNLKHRPHHSLLFYSLVATPLALYTLLNSTSIYATQATILVSLLAGLAFVIGLFKYWQHST